MVDIINKFIRTTQELTRQKADTGEEPTIEEIAIAMDITVDRAKEIKILGKVFDTEVNIQDRSHMSFPVIIGRNILTGNFVVDTEKNHNIYESIHVIQSRKIKPIYQ